MKKNIGILTYHYSTNYGGVLQAYGLQQVLKEKGFDVEIINYVPKSYNNKVFTRHSIISEFKKLLKLETSFFLFSKKIAIKLINNSRVFKKFEDFRRKKMSVGHKVTELSSNLDKFDFVIVGSDQVWNKVEQKNLLYFLNFQLIAKKVAYATDSIYEKPLIESQSKLKDCLDDFYEIMVRNEHTQKFVKNVCSRDVKIVADPSLLYNYNDLIQKKKSEKYIFAYILGDEIKGGHHKVISKIKSKYGDLPIYLAQISNMDFCFSKFSDKTFYDLSPSQWVSFISNAAFVYTDSFHGCLFALKYKIPLIAYYSSKVRSTRFIALKKRYCLENIIYNDSEYVNLNAKIHYGAISKSINNDVTNSLSLLLKTLNK
jgi:hypothetical protein